MPASYVLVTHFGDTETTWCEPLDELRRVGPVVHVDDAVENDEHPNTVIDKPPIGRICPVQPNGGVRCRREIGGIPRVGARELARSKESHPPGPSLGGIGELGQHLSSATVSTAHGTCGQVWVAGPSFPGHVWSGLAQYRGGQGDDEADDLDRREVLVENCPSERGGCDG